MSNKKALQIATKQLNKAKALSKPKDIIYDPRGQWKYPGQNTRIPSNRITMKGVPYPVYGQPNRGQAQMMYPGAEYLFPGADYVDEYPEMAVGGAAGCPPNCPPNANDSLAVYKNALEQKAYYDKLRQYFLPPRLDKDPLSLSTVKKNIKQLEKEHLQYTDQSFWTPEEKKKFNEIKKKIKSNKDPNISYIVDAITGALDPNAPALRYDSRISPQGMMNYDPIEKQFTSKEQAIIDKINNNKNTRLNIGAITLYDPSKADSMGGTKAQWLDYAKKHKIPEREMIGILYKLKINNEARQKLKGFITYIPYYDPIAVKPSKLLTDDEVRLRYKKYGRDGISESQLKRLGLLDDKKSDVVKDNKNVRPPVKDIKQITEPEPIKDDVVKTQDNVYKDVVLDKLPLKDITLNTPKGELIKGEPEEYYSPQYIQPGYKKTYPALYMKHHTSGQLIPHARPALTTQYKATPYSRVLQKVTGYDPRYMEGYTDEEGNYIPGEAEKAELEKRRIQFKGLSSPQDKAAQEEYNRAYDEYENEKAKQKFYSNIIKSGVFQNTRSKYQPGGETGCPEGYAFNPKTGECVEWNPTIWSSEEQPTSFDPVGDVIYMNPNDRPEGMSDEEYAQLYQDQLEHEQLHRLQWKNDELKGQNQTPLRMPSTVDNQEYPGDHYYNRRSEEVDYLHNYWKNHHPEEAEFIPDDVIYNSETDPAMYVLPWTVEGEARDYEYATHGGMESLFPKKQDGGPYNTDGPVAQEEYMEDYPVDSLPKIYGHEPEDYQRFLDYNQTAPENRRGYEEYKYGDPNSYDHYGMWDALGKPKDFQEALQMNPDWQPDEYDGMYHGFSVNPNTGVFLKSGKPGLKEGDTTWMEIKDHYLSPRSNENTPVFDIDLQRFRYIPKEEDGGEETTPPADGIAQRVEYAEGQTPEGFAQGMPVYTEVTKKAEAPYWLDVSREYENKNSKQAFIDKKKRDYLKNTNRGLSKLAGISMDNFPEQVERNFANEYDYKKNTYVAKKLGKKFGFSPRRRGEWVDELSKGERNVIANSKFESKLQPSYWSRSLAGLQELYGDVYAPGMSSRISIPGLTKKEQKEIQDSKLGALETLSIWDTPGAYFANLINQTGNTSYGAGYREAPGYISGEKMSGVTDLHAMALNPLNYTLPYDIAAAAPSIIKGVGNVARTTGKFLTEATPLRNAYKVNPWAFKPNSKAYYRMIGKEGYADALESGVIRPPQTSRVFDQGSQKYIDIPIPAYEEAYYNAQFPLDRRWYPNSIKKIDPKKAAQAEKSGYQGPYMAEVTGNSSLFENSKNVASYAGPNSSQTVTYSKEFIPINTPGVKFYKEDWLRGYKEVPTSLPGSSNSEIIGLSDYLKPEYRATQAKLNNLFAPESKSLSGKEMLDDFRKRIRTPEGLGRLKDLGINDVNKFNDLVLKEIDNEIAYFTDNPFTGEHIALHKDIPENIIKKITRHELEHAVQRVLNRPTEVIQRAFRPEEIVSQGGLTEIDDILGNLDFVGKPSETFVGKPLSPVPIEMPGPEKLFSDPQRNLDYFVHGSRGKEKSAFLGEIQQSMLEDGIIDDVYENITPEKVKEAYSAYMENPAKDKYKLRLFEIIKPTDQNFNKLSKGLNKMLSLAVPVTIGVGAASYEKKQGGIVTSLSKKEIDDLVAQGYTIEDED